MTNTILLLICKQFDSIFWTSGSYPNFYFVQTNYALTLAERTCDFKQFQLFETQIKQKVSTITDIRNYAELFDKSNEVMLLLSSQIWSDCALMFEELTTIYQNPTVTLDVVDSTTCIHRFGSREYSVDPCCNQT